MTSLPQRFTVYRIYDGDGALLYVGASRWFAARMRAHEVKAEWWETVATVTVEHHQDEASMAKAEQAAIATEDPIHNRRAQPYPKTRTAAEPEVALVIGLRIRAERRARGWTQKQLAEMVYLRSGVTVCQWEAGDRVPTRPTQHYLAQVFGIDHATLFAEVSEDAEEAA